MSARNYEVGYGHPPKHTRFKKGHSGNPKGRPKGTQNLKSDLVAELNERILVREGERAQRMSKQRALVKSLMTRTLKGDARAANLLLSMMLRLLDTGEVAGEFDAPLDVEDLAILDRFFEARLVSKPAEAEVPTEPSAKGSSPAPESATAGPVQPRFRRTRPPRGGRE